MSYIKSCVWEVRYIGGEGGPKSGGLREERSGVERSGKR
jgi:hypothetical protein